MTAATTAPTWRRRGVPHAFASEHHAHVGLAAQGETEMSDWDLVERASADKPGKVRHRRTYKLVPGSAHLYNEGDLHSPSRAGPTWLIRIEGTNMERVKRLKYEPA